MEQSLIDATERYAETIRNTDVYKNYQGQLFLIRQNPEKYQRVNEFRRKNYELQQSDGRDMDERIEALAEARYEGTRHTVRMPSLPYVSLFSIRRDYGMPRSP